MNAPPAGPWNKQLIAAVGLGVAALYLLGLGATDLWAPDEPRYAHVTDEIVTGGHGTAGLIVMHVDGEPYSEKPPLYFWLAAVASAPAGRVTEMSARLPSALAGLAAIALTAVLGRRLLGPGAALWGAVVLATVFDFAFLARRARLDVLLTLTAVTAFYALLRIDRREGSRRGNAALLHGAMGLGVLTKGPVALLPLLAAAVYLTWERRLRDWRRLAPPWAWLLSVGPALLWLVSAAALAPGTSFDETLWRNTIGRFFQGVSKAEPWYFFFYQLPVNFLPWTLLWPLALVETRRALRAAADDPMEARGWRLLVSWAATWFIFFTLSTGKRGLYLLPSFPALALLCGAALERWLTRRSALPQSAERAFAGLLALLAAGGTAILALAGRPLPPEPSVALPGAFGALLVAVAFASWALARRLRAPTARVALAIGLVGAVELAVFTLLHPAFDPSKSARPIADSAGALLGDREHIGLYRHQAMIGGLAFYSGRQIEKLRTTADVERFVSEGGRVIAAKANMRREIEEGGDFEIVSEHRAGKRRYLVLRALDRGI